MINPAELMQIFKDIQQKMDYLVKDNKELHAKLDMLVHSKEIVNIPSVWESTTSGPTQFATLTVASEGTMVVDARANVSKPKQDTYAYFKSLEASREKVAPFIDNSSKGTHFMLFYKMDCGSCVDVLNQLKTDLTEENLKSNVLSIIPRDSVYAVELVNRFKVKAYPSLVYLHNSKVTKIYTGLEIAPFLKTIF